MNKVVVDNIEFDPYFMLDVTEDSSIKMINNNFRKKAKIVHTDRLTKEEKKNEKLVKERIKHFNVLMKCYEYLIDRKQSYNNKNFGFENFNINLVEHNTDFNKFNKMFEEERHEKPTDFGYEIKDRLTSIKEYEYFDEKPKQIFDAKQFNKDDFNKLFEYNRNMHLDKNGINNTVIHKSTDGFYGYNTADVSSGVANLSSYNGIMIEGDNYGQLGVGYNDGNYADYRQAYNACENPSKMEIPEDYKFVSEEELSKEKALKEFEKQKMLRKIENAVEMDKNRNRNDFKRANDEFNKRMELNMKDELEMNKKFIKKYENLYPKKVIEEAMGSVKITEDEIPYSS